ncbi:MAG: hypothetical protein R3B45_13630 [Bdellovibrionota bacterium]
MLTFHFLLRAQTLPSCDFQVFGSRYENETSTRPSFKGSKT